MCLLGPRISGRASRYLLCGHVQSNLPVRAFVRCSFAGCACVRALRSVLISVYIVCLYGTKTHTHTQTHTHKEPHSPLTELAYCDTMSTSKVNRSLAPPGRQPLDGSKPALVASSHPPTPAKEEATGSVHQDNYTPPGWVPVSPIPYASCTLLCIKCDAPRSCGEPRVAQQ